MLIPLTMFRSSPFYVVYEDEVAGGWTLVPRAPVTSPLNDEHERDFSFFNGSG